ncbi:glycosyltransferase family 39 protein [Candidatus Woesearchaeota archaeon]|nr:glycosyltransferase family 39 protein [Candidatus Woesearchaeota archaeon]
MNEKHLLGLLFVLPLLVGAYFLNEGLFHYDAIVLAQAVEQSFETGSVHPAVNGRYGAVVLTAIVYLPFWLAGKNADVAVRFASVLFYALSIPAAFLFVRKLFGNVRTGVYAALLFASAPVYSSPNTFGKEHGMALFFVFLSFYFLLKGLQDKVPRYLVYSAVVLVASHAVREATLYFLPLYGFLAVCLRSRLSVRDRVLAVVIPYVAGFMVLYFAYFDAVIAKTLFPAQAGTAYLLPRQELRALALLSLRQSTPVLLALAGGFGVVVGVWKKSLPTMFMAAWLLSSFAFFANISTFAARYLDVFVFALCVLAAVALAGIPSKYAWAGHMVVAYLCVSSLWMIVPVLSARSDYNGQVRVGEWIAAHTPDNAVIITQDDAPFVSYYGKRKVLGPPRGELSKSVEFVRLVSALIVNKTPVFLTVSGLFDDPDDINKNLFPRYFDFVSNKTILSEDFHNAEIRQQRYYQIIWKLGVRSNASQTKPVQRLSVPFHSN